MGLGRRGAVSVLPPGDQGRSRAGQWPAVRNGRGAVRRQRGRLVGCLSVLSEGTEGLLVSSRALVILGEEAFVGGGGVGRRDPEESCAGRGCAASSVAGGGGGGVVGGEEKTVLQAASTITFHYIRRTHRLDPCSLM